VRTKISVSVEPSDTLERTILLVVKLPVTDTLPVNCWVLSKLFPNTLDPLEYTIEDVICCTFNVWATTCPVTVKEPVIIWLPLNWFEPVVAKEGLLIPLPSPINEPEKIDPVSAPVTDRDPVI
jgi:hypothetical protein